MLQQSPLQDGLTDVPLGKVACVVTHLVMETAAPLRPVEMAEQLTLRHVETPDVSWYQDLFRRVGTDPWMWIERLMLDAEALSEIIQHPDVAIYALEVNGKDEGLLELDFRDQGLCQLAYFGVTPEHVGKGAGRFLMNEAVNKAWAPDRGIERFQVHTCTLDHPAALAFYIRSGFSPVRQQIDIFDDPRLTGLVPRSTAPHIPIIEDAPQT